MEDGSRRSAILYSQFSILELCHVSASATASSAATCSEASSGQNVFETTLVFVLRIAWNQRRQPILWNHHSRCSPHSFLRARTNVASTASGGSTKWAAAAGSRQSATRRPTSSRRRSGPKTLPSTSPQTRQSQTRRRDKARGWRIENRG